MRHSRAALTIALTLCVSAACTSGAEEVDLQAGTRGTDTTALTTTTDAEPTSTVGTVPNSTSSTSTAPDELTAGLGSRAGECPDAQIANLFLAPDAASPVGISEWEVTIADPVAAYLPRDYESDFRLLRKAGALMLRMVQTPLPDPSQPPSSEVLSVGDELFPIVNEATRAYFRVLDYFKATCPGLITVS